MGLHACLLCCFTDFGINGHQKPKAKVTSQIARAQPPGHQLVYTIDCMTRAMTCGSIGRETDEGRMDAEVQGRCG